MRAKSLTRSESIRAFRAAHKVPDLDRFLSKIDKNGPNGCWNWTGGCDSNGYGVFWLDGKNVKANRQALIFFHGPIPDGQFALHECDNKACVNPYAGHLYAGTHQDNMQDAHERGRFYRGAQIAKFVRFPGLIDRMRDLRCAGYTIETLCGHLGIERSTYFEWQKGER